MGNTLAAYGRANAFSNTGKTLLNTALAIREMNQRAEATKFENAINLEKLNIEKAAADREKTKFEWAEKDRAEKEAQLSMPIPVTRYLGVDYTTDPAKKMMFEKAKELGIIKEAGGVPYTTRRDVPVFAQYMKDDIEWTKQLNDANLSKLKGQLDEIGTALSEEKNPKKVDELNAQRKLIEDRIGAVIGSGQKIDEEFQKKMALEKEKSEAREEVAKIRAEAAKDVADIRAEVSKAIADMRVEAAERKAESTPAKVGTLNQVNRALVRRYLPFAKANLGESAEAAKIIEGINISLGSSDQFGGTVNDARLYENLNPVQRKGYDWVKARAEKYSATMSPEAAVEKAWQEGMAERDRQLGGKSGGGTPPKGYTLVPNKTYKGKAVYHNPNAPKGKEYWTP